jgi:hypothetical protein
MSEITIIIPHRRGERCDEALISLSKQTFKDFITFTVEDYEGKGAPNARNRGFSMAPRSKYVLFSDNDIIWYENALEILHKTLENHPEATYSYSGFVVYNKQLNQKIHYRAIDFNGELLKKGNYINTTSLIRWDDFPGFDENLKRLQDWELWLRLLSQDKPGVCCGEELFASVFKPGISTSGEDLLEQSEKYIKGKHNV